jgi:plasmid stabilization system protein ParE
VRVRFTPSAAERFVEILEHMHRENPLAALRLRNRAERLLRRLERYPESGRRLPEFPELPHREVIVRPYRFFYRVHGQTVWIVGVWHAAQQAQEPVK